MNTQFKVGGNYKTVGGVYGKIDAINADENGSPLVGRIFDGNAVIYLTWTKDGKFLNAVGKRDHDLIPDETPHPDLADIKKSLASDWYVCGGRTFRHYLRGYDGWEYGYVTCDGDGYWVMGRDGKELAMLDNLDDVAEFIARRWH